jgi:carbon monoxide dehydrogenase subunit G
VIRSSIEIGAPTERVWRVMSDTDRWHEWTPSVTSATRLGGLPFAVGTRVLIRQPKFPPALWKITAIEPGKSFTWVSVAPGLRVVGTHQVLRRGEGSQARLSLEFDGFLGGLMARLTAGITQRYVDLEAAGLKARSENPAFRL